MSNNNPEDFFEQLGDIDAEKVALETAAKGLTDMFKAFRQQGLTSEEAAVLVTTLMNGDHYNGNSESNI